MADVRPFRAIRPRDDLAAEVIALPYDVPTLAECLELAKNPHSFLHITRSEVDLPAGADAHTPTAFPRTLSNGNVPGERDRRRDQFRAATTSPQLTFSGRSRS